MSDAPASEPSLAGLQVLVTRPRSSARDLCAAIRARGGKALCMPLVEIHALRDGSFTAARRKRVEEADWIVFVSPSAALHGVRRIGAGTLRGRGARVAAVGRGTARRLREAGVADVVHPPCSSSSEALLKLDCFNEVAGRRVVIVRGEDGRELLADVLRRRGATVDYLPVYRRVPAAPGGLDDVRRWLDGSHPVLLLTSAAAVAGLRDRLPAALMRRILTQRLLVPGRRLERICREAGWRGAIDVLADPGDAAVLRALSDLSNRIDDCDERAE